MSEIKKYIQQPLFKITSLNSIHILLKIIFGFITSKALAIFVGANGMGYVGNFRAFLNVVENFSLLGIQNAVVKYIAEYQDDKLKLKSVLATFGVLLLGTSILISLALIFGAHYLSKQIFYHSETFSFYVLYFSYFISIIYIFNILYFCCKWLSRI